MTPLMRYMTMNIFQVGESRGGCHCLYCQPGRVRSLACSRASYFPGPTLCDVSQEPPALYRKFHSNWEGGIRQCHGSSSVSSTTHETRPRKDLPEGRQQATGLRITAAPHPPPSSSQMGGGYPTDLHPGSESFGHIVRSHRDVYEDAADCLLNADWLRRGGRQGSLGEHGGKGAEDGGGVEATGEVARNW